MKPIRPALTRLAAVVATAALCVGAGFVVLDRHREGVAAQLDASSDTFVPGDELGANADAGGIPEAPGSARLTPEGVVFGGPGKARTLVLHDAGGPEEPAQGELDGLNAALLASHFGTVTVVAAESYRPGSVQHYDAVLYVGSSDEALPQVLLTDVTSTKTPVVWAGHNVEQFAGVGGGLESFQSKYGWDPATVRQDDADRPRAVRYGDHLVLRDAENNPEGIRAPILDESNRVTVLAQAPCGDPAAPSPCTNPVAQGRDWLPWAIRSANLTYVAEVPFSYVEENDRYLVYADLLYEALGPDVVPIRQAAVRLEDISPVSDPRKIRADADYLSSVGVPFAMAVIPRYVDANGVENGGRATSVTLAQAPEVVKALKYAISKGGTLVQHGTTHQFQNRHNPYNAVSAADYEFLHATCDPAADLERAIGACDRDSRVIEAGPIGLDSVSGWRARIADGRNLFLEAGLPAPEIFETPHYAGSTNAYRAIALEYPFRYERARYASGLLSGTPGKDLLSVHFPYRVTDPFGATILPENLGNYAPVAFSAQPPRMPQEIVDTARANLAVRESTASFFFHAYLPTEQLAQTVTGIRELGYTFVPATELR